MILNKQEWEQIDEITAILLKYRHLLNNREKAAVCAFYDLTIETTKKEKEQRQRAAARIADKRKSDPDYARPEREHKKKRKSK